MVTAKHILRLNLDQRPLVKERDIVMLSVITTYFFKKPLIGLRLTRPQKVGETRGHGWGHAPPGMDCEAEKLPESELWA